MLKRDPDEYPPSSAEEQARSRRLLADVLSADLGEVAVLGEGRSSSLGVTFVAPSHRYGTSHAMVSLGRPEVHLALTYATPDELRRLAAMAMLAAYNLDGGS